MKDSELADEIITRLNKLIEDPDVRADLGKLIEARIPCTATTLNHPSIQAHSSGGTDPTGLVGFLGVLNGFVGTLSEGPRVGWGYIAAVFDDDMKLTHFRRTDIP